MRVYRRVGTGVATNASAAVCWKQPINWRSDGEPSGGGSALEARATYRCRCGAKTAASDVEPSTPETHPAHAPNVPNSTELATPVLAPSRACHQRRPYKTEQTLADHSFSSAPLARIAAQTRHKGSLDSSTATSDLTSPHHHSGRDLRLGPTS